MDLDFLVINTGPLVLLEKAQALEIVGQLPFHFVCPAAVRTELDAGLASGFAHVRPSWLEVQPLSSPISALTKAALDPGEAEVIELALERGYRKVCLDDLRGRRWASAVGLRVVGALGLLVLAKDRQIIPAVKPFTDRLLSAGAWYSPSLIAKILSAVGE